MVTVFINNIIYSRPSLTLDINPHEIDTIILLLATF